MFQRGSRIFCWKSAVSTLDCPGDFTDKNWGSNAVNAESNWVWKKPASGEESSIHDDLPDFDNDPGNTYAKFIAPDSTSAWLKSDPVGPSNLFNLGPAFADVMRHVESHALGIMRKLGIKKAQIFINNPNHNGPCDTFCRQQLPGIMKEGEELEIIFPTSTGGAGWGTLTKDGWKEINKF